MDTAWGRKRTVMAAMRAPTFTGLTDQQEMLAATLRTHRLLTTRQLWRLCMPHLKAKASGGSDIPDGILDAVRTLDRLGLTAWTPARMPGKVRAHYLTPMGWEYTKGKADNRSYRLTMQKAAGRNQLHTLRVGDVFGRFVEAARERGDVCGPLDCRRELSHECGIQETTLGYTTSMPKVVTSDALIRYEDHSGERPKIRRWFLELDRSSLDLDEVRAKIEGYHEAVRWAGKSDPDVRWNGLFPPVLWVVEGRAHHPAGELVEDSRGPKGQIGSIIRTVREHSHYVRQLRAVEGESLQPATYLTTYEVFMKAGPFAPIWYLLADAWTLRSIL